MKHPIVNSLLVALKKTIPAVLLLGSLSFMSAPAAKAQFTLTFTDDGTNTSLSYSGSWALDSTDDSSVFPPPPLRRVDPALGGILNIGGFYSYVDTNLIAGTLVPITSERNADSFVGDAWGYLVQGPSAYLYGPSGYTTGTAIVGGLTFHNTSLGDLGLTVGQTGSFTLGGTSISWSAGSAVPEPNSFALVAGLCCLGFGLGRRRRHAPSAI